MRLLRHTFIVIIFLISAVIGFNALLPLYKSFILNDDAVFQTTLLKDARVKLAYLLDNRQWLSFALQAGEDKVRVMSNVLLDKDYQVTEADRFLYSIEFEILNDKDEVIKAARFYHRGGQKVYADEATGLHYVSTRVYQEDVNPADSRIHLVNLRGLKNATQIRFKSGNYEYPVQKIALSAYQKKKIADRKLDYAWQRLGDKRREQLAKVSVYDASIITDAEQRWLLINQWAPMGPEGVDGEDYSIQKLYVVREVENDVQINVPAVPSTGLAIYPGRYGMLTLPEDNNKLIISWSLFTGKSALQSKEQINIEWWGRPATRYKKWTPALSVNQLIINRDSGVLRISSSQPVVIRVWRGDKTQKNEITPKPAYLRLYSADSSPLEYKINHVRGFKTPIRFDVRNIDGVTRTDITYRFIDKNNSLIKSGKLKLHSPLSAYDMLVADTERWITEPESFYFNLPGRVHKVVFDAPPGVWISAYTRPKYLPYKQYNPVSIEQQQLQIPVWFAVRPHQWKKNMRSGYTQLITVQRRPPKLDPRLLVGEYRWDQFYPENNWKGRNLLTPLEEHQVFRVEALSSRFLKLSNQQESQLEFIAKNGTHSLRPSLIYSQAKNQMLSLRLWLNEKLFFETQVRARSGEIQLPLLSAGKHRVRIESSVVGNASSLNLDAPAFYINNTNNLQAENRSIIMLKRLGVELTTKPLSFTVLKENSEELLALRIYTRQSIQKKYNISVTIKNKDKRNKGPFNNWSLLNRKYELSPFNRVNKTLTSPLILNVNQGEANEYLFFIPLGSDLPSDKNYTLEVSLQQGEPTYIILTRSIPGLYPSRQIYPDIELESDYE
jgi:hypothetical protein